MLIFDIGANIGNWALANQNNNTIISVEASPNTFSALKHNIQAYSNITPLHYAVAPDSSDNFITFYHCASSHVLSTLNKDWLTSPHSRFGKLESSIVEYKVPTITIDKLISLYGIPSLLKLDVEGAEHIVLKSLTQKVPLLCFEWASEWKTQNKECIDHLVSIGFTKFHIQLEDHYTYRPMHLELNSKSVCELLDTTTPKIHWGMIWAI
jgi:FkbM family methyltransferase